MASLADNPPLLLLNHDTLRFHRLSDPIRRHRNHSTSLTKEERSHRLLLARFLRSRVRKRDVFLAARVASRNQEYVDIAVGRIHDAASSWFCALRPLDRALGDASRLLGPVHAVWIHLHGDWGWFVEHA